MSFVAASALQQQRCFRDEFSTARSGGKVHIEAQGKTMLCMPIVVNMFMTRVYSYNVNIIAKSPDTFKKARLTLLNCHGVCLPPK